MSVGNRRRVNEHVWCLNILRNAWAQMMTVNARVLVCCIEQMKSSDCTDEPQVHECAGCLLGCRCVCECVHSPLKDAGRDTLLCQARTSARRLHVLSQRAHSWISHQLPPSLPKLWKTNPRRYVCVCVCVCVRVCVSDSVRALTSFSCWLSFTICWGPSPLITLKGSVLTCTRVCLWAAYWPKSV